MTTNLCKTCGGALVQLDDRTWECKYCKNVYEDESVMKDAETLRSLLDEQKIEKVSNLRRNLYDAISEKYTDSEEICRICASLKALLPDDFMANFYYTANHATPKEISRAIRDIEVEGNESYIDGIVEHMLSSMRSEYALPLQNLVERAYKNTDMAKFEQLATRISEEMERVNAGIYETSVPRDVFVAYSSRDMRKVEELVEYLEDNGLDCFVAVRNLRHGRGAKQNYEKALHEAMENCKCVVFVSSQNSRSMECDALSVELKYIKNTDLLNAPAEYRKNYASMPKRYKMNRVEYRLDNVKTQPYAEKVISEFFSGLEFAYSPAEVVDRIYNFDEAEDDTPEITVAPTQNTSKFCAKCGTETVQATKFCPSCGNETFVSSKEVYEELRAQEEELRKQKLEAERRALEEEKRRFEEEKLRSDEERRRAEAERLKAESERIAAEKERARIEQERKRLEAEQKANNNFYYNNTPTTTYNPPPKKKYTSAYNPEPVGKQKDKWIAFFLCLFLGYLGGHKFYEGKIFTGIIYMCTCGLGGFGVIIDLIVIFCKPNPYYLKRKKK